MISQNAVTVQVKLQGYLQNGEYQTETGSASTETLFSVPPRKVLEHEQMNANAGSTAFIRNRAREGRHFSVRSTGTALGMRNPDPADAFAYANVTISFSAMEVHRGGQLIPLTRKEFNTLAYLLRNAPRVISRDELLNEVWGYESYPCTRTVDNHILRLRKKLELRADRPRHLRTVHGRGYRFLP